MLYIYVRYAIFKKVEERKEERLELRKMKDDDDGDHDDRLFK